MQGRMKVHSSVKRHVSMPARNHSRRMIISGSSPKVQEAETSTTETKQNDFGMGDVLGPIGLTIGGDVKQAPQAAKRNASTDGNGIALGPISLSFGTEFGDNQAGGSHGTHASELASSSMQEAAPSIHSMTTEEWRQRYEKDGTVDLWLEEEFNAGSRLVGGRAVHKGGTYGIRTGEGPSVSQAVKRKVKIFNHFANNVVDVEVPEDRYILWEAEDEGLELPYACRMGCCTVCAVRIKEGEMYQPESLGISAELKEQGYGLMCVGYPLTDLVLETVSEDEVYELQFGENFAKQALDPKNPESIERDDFGLSLANMDE